MNRQQALRSLTILIVCGLAAWSLMSGPPPQRAPRPAPRGGFEAPEPAPVQKAKAPSSDAALPPEAASRVNAVLDYILEHRVPMPGYVGGRAFQNREGVLPRADTDGEPVRYREWDVNPRTPGVNRGPERLVTGSDGSVYYTNDHYRTFLRIRGSP